MSNAETRPQLTLRRIVATWWPLAGSWLLMSLELPALSAIIARLENPEVNLAAYGGVVFPLALIIESPIIMLLAASTALSKDWDSYSKVRRFMMSTGATLTVIHFLVAFTPIYDIIVKKVIGVPAEIVEPARIGMRIMTPWSWSIAYRRFNQGVLIRFGRSRAVGMGTIIRLGANFVVLMIGYAVKDIPGIVVGSSAVVAGVISEAAFAGLVTRPVINNQLRAAKAVDPPLTFRAFLDFYIPLAMTSLITLLANPIGSAALSRMPKALISLAVWPVASGLVFLLRSMGIAYNEVVVALLDEPFSSPNLRRFAHILALATTLLLLLILATPLSEFWFLRVSALAPDLARMGRLGMWFVLPLPALSVYQSWYQGAILFGRRTRGITESVVIYLLASIIVLGAGVLWGKIPGLYVGLAALTACVLVQSLWLWYRSRPIVCMVSKRDAQGNP